MNNSLRLKKKTRNIILKRSNPDFFIHFIYRRICHLKEKRKFKENSRVPLIKSSRITDHGMRIGKL